MKESNDNYIRALAFGILTGVGGFVLLSIVPFCGRYPMMVLVGYSIGWMVGWGSDRSRNALLPLMSAVLTMLTFVAAGYLELKDPVLLLFGAIGLLASIIAARQ